MSKLALSAVLSLVLLMTLTTASVCYGKTHPNSTTSHIQSNIDIKFRNIDSPQLTEIGQIWSINEDSKGYLWISGARGIVRFDGINHKIFRHKQSDRATIPTGYIPDILVTQDDKIWLATHKGMYLYDSSKETFNPISVSPNVVVVWDLEEDPNDGGIWIGFQGRGIGKYYPSTEKYLEYRFDSADSDNTLPAEHNYKIKLDKHGYVWTGSDNALRRLNPENGKIETYSRESPRSGYSHQGAITGFCEDNANNLWVGSTNGLYKYNYDEKLFKRYEHQTNNPFSLSKNSIGSIVLDNLGTVWITVDGGGLNIYDPDSDRFRRLYAKENIAGSFKNNSVRRGYFSKRGDLWLGFHPHGVSVSNRLGENFKLFVHDPSDPNSISSNTIHAIASSANGDLWLGTENGLNKIELDLGKVTRFPHIPGKPNSLNTKTVLSVLADSQGRVWAGTWGGGLNLYQPELEKFTHFTNQYNNPKSLPNDSVFSVFELDPQRILVGSGVALSVLDVIDGTFSSIENIHSGVEKISDFSSQYILVKDYHNLYLLNKITLRIERPNAFAEISDKIYDFYVDHDRTIWITTEQGIFRKTLEAPSFSITHQYNDSMQGHQGQIITDRNNHIWLGGSRGITALRLPTHSFKTFTSAYGLPSGSYAGPRAALKLGDKRLAFGGTDGLVILDPKIVDTRILVSRPIFTGLKVLDQQVKTYDIDSPIDRPIEDATIIKLNHDQNIVTIEYSVLDFQIPTEANYAIRLKGFDENWRAVNNHRSATYTNLNPGEYTFEVRLADKVIESTTDITSIRLKVFPPWWRTRTAYIGYALTALSILFLICYSIWNASQYDRERRINRKLRDIDKIKNEFLARTSHELRTPLNGIIGLTESVINDLSTTIDYKIKHKLDIIVNSGKRLNNIINDILDFSKLKDHKLELKLAPINLNAMIDDLFSLFLHLIGEKQVTLANKVPHDFPHFLADEQRLTQILFNLLGNALKFTPDGKIYISAHEEPDYIVISVNDTGSGICKEDQEKIFEPFKQSSNHEVSASPGTGIGLSVCRSLVELHGGTIGLHSEIGKGSIFYFTISKLLVNDTSTSTNAPKINLDESKFDAHRNYQILVVDDDAVNRLVLQSTLSKANINCVECECGNEALRLARSQNYDLIILDLMLPDIKGYDVCRQLRTKFSKTRLPIVILTADSSSETMQQGLDCGANLVLLKPISSNLFFSQIQPYLTSQREL